MFVKLYALLSEDRVRQTEMKWQIRSMLQKNTMKTRTLLLRNIYTEERTLTHRAAILDVIVMYQSKIAHLSNYFDKKIKHLKLPYHGDCDN